MTTPDAGAQAAPTVWDESFRPPSAYTPSVTILTQGVQGVAGPTGATGAQGPIGPAGTQGPTGPKGDQGIQGPGGTSVTIKGSVAAAVNLPTGLTATNNGDGYITTDTGNLHVYTHPSFVDVGLVRGPAGPAGPASTVAGPSGPIGPAGPIGATGPQGPGASVSTQMPTAGPVRVAGGAFHIFTDPATDPATTALAKDWWIGGIVV